MHWTFLSSAWPAYIFAAHLQSTGFEKQIKRRVWISIWYQVESVKSKIENIEEKKHNTKLVDLIVSYINLSDAISLFQYTQAHSKM